MPNLLQKWVYNLSSAAPLCFTFAFVWWSEKQTKIVPFISIGAGIALIMVFEIMFSYSEKHLPMIAIRTTDVSANDKEIVVYILSYVLPFASMAIQDFNLYLSCAIAGAVIVIAPFTNSAIPNPLLIFGGYHFYEISAEHGMSGYVLISKRKLRNSKELKYVKRVFEFLLIDEVK